MNDLVAPIALYPDPLLSQIMVASTYPLEVVQAYQWLQRIPGLNGPDLTQAAQQQNWDPSIQALVMFPGVLKRLNDDITWTTNLGNAFLAQQQEVMEAVQRMRQRAQQAGKLASTPQENVVTTTDGDQPVSKCARGPGGDVCPGLRSCVGLGARALVPLSGLVLGNWNRVRLRHWY